MTNSNTSDTLLALLAQADKARGFPAGTMASIMQQETGGNAKYLTDPSAYHYGLNAEGRRIAGHTGKVSTAFGPFGILESTGRDPGYGVQPLQNKSIEEQVRFAGEYLDARSKSAGSLTAGLAGYGEGAKYATQVARRRDGNSPPIAPMVAPAIQLVQAAPPAQVMAQAPVSMPVPATASQQAAPAIPEPVQVAEAAPEWNAFQQAMSRQVLPMDLNFGRSAQPVATLQPNFNKFRSWGAKA